MEITGRCFILENGMYTEITYGELMERSKSDLAGRLFLPLHGMLMEVSETDYKAFYRDKRRQKYLREISEQNEDFSCNMLTTDDFNGEDILLSDDPPVEDQVMGCIMLDKLFKVLPQLNHEERFLISSIYFQRKSERSIAAELGISQSAVHKRKHRILLKLKYFLEN